MRGTIAYVSPFVPAEWIAAHGLRPSRITLGSGGGETASGAGICPFAEAFFEEARALLARGAIRAVVAATTCDQMRRGAEGLGRSPAPPAFLMNVPHTWQSRVAHRTYVSELRRLGTFLIEWGGREPSIEDLTEALRRFDDGRRAARAARDRLGGRAFAEALADFHARGDGVFEAPVDARAPAPDAVPVAVVGGPLRAGDLGLFDLIEEAGGRVALDATDTGERTLPAPLDRRRLASDPILEIADAYFGSLPSVFRRPNRQMYEYLSREFRTRGVRALIVVHCVWCDLWRAEAGRLREWSGLPTVDVDLVGGDSARGRRETRIQALMELARGA